MTNHIRFTTGSFHFIVIDRKGIVRAIGLQPHHVETVVQKLLAEPAP
jgi:hypothetical protein